MGAKLSGSIPRATCALPPPLPAEVAPCLAKEACNRANTAFADGAHTFSLNLGSDLVLFVDNDDDPGFDQAIILVGGSLTSTALVDLG